MESDGDLMVGGIDVVGDSSEGSMVLGRGRRHRAARVPTPRWMNATTSQGVSRPQEELDYLPFSAVLLSGPGAEGGPPAAVLSGILIAQPQRPFRAERLVMGAIKNDGTDLGNAVVIDPAIYVGAVQVGAAQGTAPVSVFSPNAFGVRLSMPAAGQGTLIKIFVRIPDGFLTANTDTALVTAVLIGRAMR
jgi:hypothetical protein